MLILMFLAAICLMAPAVASDNVTHPTDDIKVSFNDTVYREDLGYIDVELPGNTSGNLKATINNVEFYNDNISSSLSIPITIPSKFKTGIRTIPLITLICFSTIFSSNPTMH